MFKSKTKMLQLTVTLLACAFLLIPTIMSVLAGITANYFKGVSSGLTLKWIYRVWELYADSIFLDATGWRGAHHRRCRGRPGPDPDRG